MTKQDEQETLENVMKSHIYSLEAGKMFYIFKLMAWLCVLFLVITMASMDIATLFVMGLGAFGIMLSVKKIREGIQLQIAFTKTLRETKKQFGDEKESSDNKGK